MSGPTVLAFGGMVRHRLGTFLEAWRGFQATDHHLNVVAGSVRRAKGGRGFGRPEKLETAASEERDRARVFGECFEVTSRYSVDFEALQPLLDEIASDALTAASGNRSICR